MLKGGGFWDDFADGFKKGFANTANALSFLPGAGLIAKATEGWRGKIPGLEGVPGLGGGSISRTGQYEGEGKRRKTARKAYEGEPHEFHEVEGAGVIGRMLKGKPAFNTTGVSQYTGGRVPPEVARRFLEEARQREAKARGGSATPSMGLSQTRGGFGTADALREAFRPKSAEEQARMAEEREYAKQLATKSGLDRIAFSNQHYQKTRGKGRKEKKPLMEGDGRKKRAEIVKRVMGERGCSMIEASKFVKAHGLY